MNEKIIEKTGNLNDLPDEFIFQDEQAYIIWISPEFFDRSLKKGFEKTIIEKHAIPERFNLRGYGYDPNKDGFFTIFATEKYVEGNIPIIIQPKFKIIETIDREAIRNDFRTLFDNITFSSIANNELKIDTKECTEILTKLQEHRL